MTNKADGNAINETKFEPLIEAYDLLRPSFPSSDRTLIDTWLRKKAVALWADPRGRKDNWQSHRLKIVGMVAATVDDTKLWNLADDGFKKQVQVNIESDGGTVDFKRRDAMHYHLYSIQPLLTLACVAQRRGYSLFTYRTPNGASLEKAVDFVRPYASGEKRHLEFGNSKGKFDVARAAAGEKEYIPHYWNPKRAVRTFSEAGCVDPKYDEAAVVVSGEPDKHFVNWRSVLNAADRAGRTR